MPRWVARLLRISIIGFGAVFIALSVIYLIAIDVFFDASFEHYLGFAAADFKPIVLSIGGMGILLVLTGCLIRFPKPPAPPQPRRKRKSKAHRH